MKAKLIDNGFYRISDKDAGSLCRSNPSVKSGTRLPLHGYERKVTIDGQEGWLTRTGHRCYLDSPSRGWVWALYAINLSKCPSVSIVNN